MKKPTPKKKPQKEKATRDNPWLTGTQLRDLFALSIVQGIYADSNTITIDAQADAVWQVADLMVSRREIVQTPLSRKEESNGHSSSLD